MNQATGKAHVSIGQRHYWMLLLLGVLLSIAAVTEVVILAMNDARQVFNREAAVTAEVINQRLKDNEAVLGGLAALHHAVDDVDYDQLSLFAGQMLKTYPHIFAIHDLVQVEHDALVPFEMQMQQQGFLTFRVREHHPDQDLQWIAVKKRPIYFPVVFLEPLEPSQAQALGFDVYSDSNLRQAIDAAITKGRISASSPYDLLQGGWGYALFKPVYTGEYVPDDRDQQFSQARRVVSLLIRADRLVTREDLHDPTVSVSLSYTDDLNQAGLLSLLAAEQQPEAGFVGWLANYISGFEFDRTLTNGDRDLQLVIRKPLSSAAIRIDLAIVAILVVVLLMVVLHMRQRFVMERETSDEALYRQQEQAAVTLHAIGDAVITTDETGNVQQLNATAERLTGWKLSDALGKPVQQVFKISDEGSSKLLDPVARCLREGKALRLGRAVRLYGHGDKQAMVEVVVSPMRNREGKLISTILVFHDVSKERLMQDHIKYQASHDMLTGLIDRREFQRLLDIALLTAADEDRQHALCYMDLDHFKVLNDTCGHIAGDELLVQLSALLLSSVRSDDLLARLGGDEFGVLFYDCPLDKAVKKADSLRRVVEDFRFVWQGKTFDVGFGIGVVPVEKDSGSIMDVLRAADAACYTAKSRGRNQIYVYHSDDPELMRLRGEMRWVTRISDALRHQQFRLYYQLIEPVQDNEPDFFHCELLMRTEGDHDELISPEEFIPTAERYNLVTDIDRWVVSTALPRIADLDARSAPGRKNLCGINLSGQSLCDESFHGYVKQLLEKHHVNPDSICFEITETTAIVNVELAIRFMHEMKALGCHFALDDFGAGVSSYTYLKRFPLDYVKIDGSFIRNMVSSPVDRAMVESVIHIAKVLGIKTVAEYVEDESIFDLLRELGVDYAQGYWIARPAPLTENVSEPQEELIHGD